MSERKSTGAFDKYGAEILEGHVYKLDPAIWPDLPEHRVVVWDEAKQKFMDHLKDDDQELEDFTCAQCPSNNMIVIGEV